jgi:hypothetical protein
MSALETWLAWPRGLIAVPEGHAKAVKTAFKTSENRIQSQSSRARRLNPAPKNIL